MKMLFLATVACLVLSLSSSAQAQKGKFGDQFCVPYCANYCKNRPGNDPLRRKCNAICLPMCHEQGH
jgi:hypothetical protein